MQKVQSIVGQRTTLPILSNVMLEAHQGKLICTTTDMEVSLRTSIEADIEEEGSTTYLHDVSLVSVETYPVIKLSYHSNPVKTVARSLRLFQDPIKESWVVYLKMIFHLCLYLRKVLVIR